MSSCILLLDEGKFMLKTTKLKAVSHWRSFTWVQGTYARAKMCVNSQDVAGHSWGAKEKATFVMRTPSILLLRVIPHKWQTWAFLFYYWFIFAQITFKHLCGYSEFLMPRSSVVLTHKECFLQDLPLARVQPAPRWSFERKRAETETRVVLQLNPRCLGCFKTSLINTNLHGSTFDIKTEMAKKEKTIFSQMWKSRFVYWLRGLLGHWRRLTRHV